MHQLQIADTLTLLEKQSGLQLEVEKRDAQHTASCLSSPMLAVLVLHNMVCKADAVRKGVIITLAASALNTCPVVKLVAETPELPLHEPQKWRVSVLTKGNVFHSNASLWGVAAQAKEWGHKEDTLGDVCLV